MTSPLKRDLHRLVTPILFETLLTFLLGVVDTFMLSQHSDEAVAAVGMDNQILQLVFLLFSVINTGTSVLCAQYFGAKLKDRFTKVAVVALLLNLAVGLTVSLALVCGAGFILDAMGVRPELMIYGRPYMQIVGGFAFAQAITTTISAILRSANLAIYPMRVIAVVNVVNIFGNYCLIFGKFGLPALGAEGAALSTSLSRVVSMTLLIIMLRRHLIPSLPRQLLRPFPIGELRKLLKIGLPSAGENASYNLQQLVLLYFVNMMGNESLAARTYVVNIVMFVYLYAICMAPGSSIVVGHLVGLGKTRGALLIGRYAWHLSMVVSLTFSVICALAGPFTTSLLTDNANIAHLVCTIFWFDIVLEIGKTINIWATNTLRATGDILYPFYLGIIVQWAVGVLCGWLFGIALGFGLVGMWVAFILDENIRGIAFIRRWNSLKWANRSFT